MPKKKEGSPAATNRTAVERKSDRELVVTRTFNAPVHIVFEAWSKPELFKLWWIPKSAGMALVSCDMDVRTGGAYRLVFRHPSFDQPMAFFGTYREVTPIRRIVWTNEEAGAEGPVSTVTFEEKGERTHIVMHELYPSKEALDTCMASGEKSCIPETFNQLEELLASRGGSPGES